MKQLTIAVAVLGLAACATTGADAPAAGAQAELAAASNDATPVDGLPPEADDAQAGETTIVATGNVRHCKKERMTGSRIPIKICATDQEREHLQNAAQETMRAIRRTESADPQR